MYGMCEAETTRSFSKLHSYKQTLQIDSPTDSGPESVCTLAVASKLLVSRLTAKVAPSTELQFLQENCPHVVSALKVQLRETKTQTDRPLALQTGRLVSFEVRIISCKKQALQPVRLIKDFTRHSFSLQF
jgi:hypothetical protein